MWQTSQEASETRPVINFQSWTGIENVAITDTVNCLNTFCFCSVTIYKFVVVDIIKRGKGGCYVYRWPHVGTAWCKTHVFINSNMAVECWYVTVTDWLDLRWWDVWANWDFTVFSYPFASFQLWMCLEINTIVSFSMAQVHWIVQSSVTEQFNDRTKQLTDLNSRPGRLYRPKVVSELPQSHVCSMHLNFG